MRICVARTSTTGNVQPHRLCHQIGLGTGSGRLSPCIVASSGEQGGGGISPVCTERSGQTEESAIGGLQGEGRAPLSLPQKTCRQARSRRLSRAAEPAATKKAYKAEASKCPPAGPIQFGAGESGSTGRP